MSEYIRKTALGVTLAIIMGSALVAGLYYLPKQTTSSSNNASRPAFSSSSSSSSDALSSKCIGAGNSSVLRLNGIIDSGETGAGLCVRYYYYGTKNQSVTFNTTAMIEIISAGPVVNALGYRSEQNANSNFSITAYPSQISIGGSTNESEGAMVIYSITPNAISNGTYAWNIGWVVTPEEQILNCNPEFLLISGNGIPNLSAVNGVCTLMQAQFPPPNTLVAQIVKVVNGT